MYKNINSLAVRRVHVVPRWDRTDRCSCLWRQRVNSYTSVQDFAVFLWSLRPKSLDFAAAFWKCCCFFFCRKLPESAKSQSHKIVLRALSQRCLLVNESFSCALVRRTWIEEGVSWMHVAMTSQNSSVLFLSSQYVVKGKKDRKFYDKHESLHGNVPNVTFL